MTIHYGYEKNDTGISLTDLYDPAEGHIVIPPVWKDKTVTEIGEALFRGEKKLTGITIPPTVTSVGWWALRECTALTEVHLPDTLVSIGYRAFSGCTALRTLTLPDSLENIGEAAFWGCTELREIILPPKIDTIKNRTFYGCRHLTDIVIPPSVRKIEWGAFENCAGLRRLTVPDGVTEIGSNALRECSGLKELNFPDGMEAISENLFGRRNLPGLERGYIPNVRLDKWEENARIILTLCYLTTADRHSFEEQRMYRNYIIENPQKIIIPAIEATDISALDGLYQMGLPWECDIDRCIEYANSLHRRDAVVSLMEYKHRAFGKASAKSILMSEFSLEDDAF